jgi:hypothetical protein
MLRREGVEDDYQVQQYAWHAEFAKLGYTKNKLKKTYPKVFAFWKRITDVIAVDPKRCQSKRFCTLCCAVAHSPISRPSNMTLSNIFLLCYFSFLQIPSTACRVSARTCRTGWARCTSTTATSAFAPA